MKGLLKKLLVGAMLAPVLFMQRLFSLIGIQHFIQGDVFDRMLEERRTVTLPYGDIIFHTPNNLTRWRADTLLTKEPETIAWIDGFENNSIFWDIGANVGSYSIYAAKRHPGLKVFSFEPSIENTYLLNRNISSNNLQKQAVAFPLALSDKAGMQLFQHITIQIGGALNSFGADYSFDGKPREFKESYNVFGVRGDDVPPMFGVPLPNYIKIDVDGIEHLILDGLSSVLSAPTVRSVLVELNMEFAEQRQLAIKACESAGLRLLEYKHSDEFFKTGEHAEIYNHIFVR